MRYEASAPHGLMFHHFHGRGHPPSEGSITAAELETLLDFVGSQRILCPEEWLERLAAGSLEDRHLCLTFDDGLRCQVDVALPVLEERGLKAFWFPYTAIFEEDRIPRLEVYRRFRNRCFADRAAFYRSFFERVGEEREVEEEEIEAFRRNFPFYTRDDARYRIVRDRRLGRERFEEVVDGMIEEAGTSPRELAEDLWMRPRDLLRLSEGGHEVGLHSHSHPTRLASLEPTVQESEYRRNRNLIRELCGHRARSAAHPVGSYGPATLEILRSLGVRCGFRSNLSPPDPGGPLNPTPLEIGREDHANVMRTLARVE